MAEEIETMSSSLSEDTPSQSQAPAPAPALSSFPAFSNEYKVHAYNRNGICSLGFMDDHYPVRSAFSLLNQVKECTSALLHFAKKTNIPILLVRIHCPSLKESQHLTFLDAYSSHLVI
ncbi:uncharacterized protein LOC126705536 isoform X3 [Quercus robur]|uniref:uncharacterized protein LOC126705536 isoform X3 n=1 Tax=Quercus robur TaxID=38942 RepID=UPI002163210F|nr:uncharacterized protein LOC126705536 isoform X3 [Quercus robur]